MTRINPVSEADTVEVMPEVRASDDELINAGRKLRVSLPRQPPQPATSIVVSHGGKSEALSMQLNRTIRVPDNKDINALPPGLGAFPLFKVRDYTQNMPKDMVKKGGIFFPMYQREAMWISFSAGAPFAIKIYVGGVNAVSGFPMTENDKTKEKRKKMLNSGKPIQDYMVLPEQHWLDGIASEDGKIRQFVAQPKGSGFSVEAQVTGEENVGGIQIEIIPIKKNFPTEFDVRYEDKEQKVVTRTFNLANKGLTEESTWKDVKLRIRDEFDIAVEEQLLSNHTSKPLGPRQFDMDFDDDVQLGDVYFPVKFSTLSVTHIQSEPVRRGMFRARCGAPQANVMLACAAPPPSGMAPMNTMMMDSASGPESASEVNEMGLAAGGLINQVIEADPYPSDVWDVEASVMVNLQILDIESFRNVTGQPAPDTPVDAKTYANHGYPFFELWGEEKSGIKGEFEEVKSVAQIMEDRAKAEGKTHTEEETVKFRVTQLGRPFTSTFRPVKVLQEELENLHI
nr:uncharacterized protein CTRU02_03247 [Colletotrichum truncatum]KAF6797216.1 integral membrane protein [Colletotrichum truncatum]